jgi:N-acetylmuramic acid 6-phosphate etherase
LLSAQEYYAKLDLPAFLSPFIEAESKVYQDKDFLIYRSSPEFGISILTDTTERSPTFSLFPFEGNADNQINPSLSYFIIEADIVVNIFIS